VLLYRHPGLQGLEIWHGLARHTALYQLRDDKPAYFAGLSEFLARLHAGTAETAGGNPLGVAAGFARLILTGGEAAAASPFIDWPHEVADAGPFAARRGAQAVWRELGWQRPAAIDLGQSRLKVITPGGGKCFERHLPFGHNALDAETGRARLGEWIRRAIPSGCDGVVLALPVALDGDGVASPSTYPGLSGPVEPLFSPLFPAMHWAVVNDAVLAARGYPPPDEQKTLVLTLGFGVGAAVWHSHALTN
jgi:hypothetical protein